MSAPAATEARASSAATLIEEATAPVLSKRQQKKRKHREQAQEQREAAPATPKRRHHDPADAPKKHTTGKVQQPTETIIADGLRYIKPYPFEMSFYVKKRWYGASLLEMLRIEYKNPLLDYYDRLIAAGCVQVQPARSSSKRITDPAIVLQHVVQPNDLVCLTMHRHEPPVAATQIEILHHGRASGEPAPADENAASMEVDVEASSSAETIVVNKPGGIPVHASGRYFSNTIVGILKSEHDIDAIPVHRLDRITSGLLLLSLTRSNGIALSRELSERRVQKEYLARVVGRFPEGRTTVEKAISLKGERATKREEEKAAAAEVRTDAVGEQKDELPKSKTVQPSNPFMSSHIPARISADAASAEAGISSSSSPDLKTASTEFEFLSFDGHTSLIRCRPLTGRTHQIRLHLSSLGHPIANDFVYGGRWYASNTYTDRAAEVYAQAGVEWQPGCAECDQCRQDVERAVAVKPSSSSIALSAAATSPAAVGASSSSIPSALYCSFIWLHCSRYAGPTWCYEAPLPAWAAADFDSAAAMAHPVHVHAQQIRLEDAADE